ncbi:MAG: ABC transporter substrate-binding protein, partial [Anaerolineales bacterium]
MRKITYFSVSLLAVIGLLLSSCQPQVVVEEKVVIQEKEVVKEVEVEVEKEVIKEVEKPVTEYVEVEKIVEVEKAGAAETGNAGPYPVQYVNAEAAGVTISSYSGNPLFADLPPVADRLPTEPAVVLNLDTIGSYGGELAGPTTNPSCCGWDVLEMRLQRLLMIDTDLSTPIPNIAKGWEVSDDNTTFTFHLREGHKFSDGQPFTCRDFEFYHNDVLANTELTAAPSGTWTSGGELVDFKCVDETTVQYKFAEAKPTFLLALASEVGNRGFRPAHYFEQMHIDYNADANKKAEDAGYENWVQMFNAHMSPYNFTWNLGSEIDPGAPTLNTHVFDSEDDFGNKLYTANPYFFKVDTAGNQLPYTDSLRRILVEDLEVQDLKAIAGEYTHFGWGKLTSYPTYRANEEAGGYRTALATYNRGNEYSFIFNLTHPDP